MRVSINSQIIQEDYCLSSNLLVFKILVDIIAYLDSEDPSNWSFSDFLSSNFDTIVNSPPDASDINTLNGTWWNRFSFEVGKKGHKAIKVNILQFC